HRKEGRILHGNDTGAFPAQRSMSPGGGGHPPTGRRCSGGSGWPARAERPRPWIEKPMEKPAEKAGLVVHRSCRTIRPSSASVAIAQTLLAGLCDPPDGAVRLDEAAILQ